MVTLLAIAPDGSSQRLRFPTDAEGLRRTGHSLYRLAWSGTLGRTVTIPEDRARCAAA